MTEDGLLESLPEPGGHDVVKDRVDGGTGVHENDGDFVKHIMVDWTQSFAPHINEVGHYSDDVEG